MNFLFIPYFMSISPLILSSYQHILGSKAVGAIALSRDVTLASFYSFHSLFLFSLFLSLSLALFLSLSLSFSLSFFLSLSFSLSLSLSFFHFLLISFFSHNLAVNTRCPEVLPAKKYIVQYQNGISSVSNTINGIPNDITVVRHSTICDVTILFLFYFVSFHFMFFFQSVSYISMDFKVTCHALKFPLTFFSPTFLLLCHFLISFLPFFHSLSLSLYYHSFLCVSVYAFTNTYFFSLFLCRVYPLSTRMQFIIEVSPFTSFGHWLFLPFSFL